MNGPGLGMSQLSTHPAVSVSFPTVKGAGPRLLAGNRLGGDRMGMIGDAKSSGKYSSAPMDGARPDGRLRPR